MKQILLNVQDQIQCRKLNSFKDVLTRQTEVPHNDENLRKQNSLDNAEGIGISIEQISALIAAEQFVCTLKNIENGKTLKVICENSNNNKRIND